MPTALLDGLNPEQRRAVETVEGAVLIVAGAGSGKTRVLTQRIAYLVREHAVRPHEILAITFTNRAAKEMVERVGESMGGSARGMWVMTFHAACARILRAEAELIGFRPGFTIYDQGDQVRLVRDVLEDELEKDPKRYPPRGIHARISDAKNRLVGPEQFAGEVSGFFDQTVAEVYGRYQRRLLQAGAMDFDDLLMHAVRLLEDVPDVRERYQRRFRFVMVDEYQDTNHAQYRLVRALSATHGNVCVVGDSDQSIYSWRGADIRNILDFEQDFPNASTIRLEQNYRSTQAILDAANGVIEHNRDRQPKRLWSDLGNGEKVKIVECEDEQAEARLVVTRIAQLMDEGYSASDIAVFYRTNAQSRTIEDLLRRHDIAYQVVGGLRFYDRAEVRDALGYLQVLANPSDALTLRRIINAPRRGIGDTTVSRLVQHAEAFGMTLRESLREADDALPNAAARRNVTAFGELLDRLEELARSLSVAELLERVLEDTGYRETLREERTIEARGRLENLDELVGVARDFDSRVDEGPRDLATFLQELSLVSDADEDEHTHRSLVTLMTLHTAKGLEFPVVFLVGMEDGVFPHVRAIEEGNLEEERRLCYVGMTRAREHLCLLYCRSRMLFGSRNSNPPSTFLAEIPAAVVDHERMRPTYQSLSRATVPGTRDGGWGPGRAGWERERSSGFRSAPAPSATTTVPKPVAARPKADAPILGTGDTVKHAKWGEGIVIGVESTDIVIVRFPTEGEKRLHVGYAPIEKV
jgi:DNA helicase-2/ATP-dependent DNA helicase PcrA